MGSPSARLNTLESLRPWIESGLEFIMRSGIPVQEESSVDQVSESAHSPVQESVPVQQVSPSPVQQPSPQPPRHHAAPSPVQPVQEQPAVRQVPTLPESWSGFLRFAKASQPQVIMTYMELGLDLGGQPDSRRSAALKNIQAHLRWPPGTMNFWPVAALIDGALQPSTEMFWKGWEQWRVPNIVCFGDEAMQVILPGADPSITTHMLEHVTIYKLPPLTHLITMLPHEQQMSVDELLKIRV